MASYTIFDPPGQTIIPKDPEPAETPAQPATQTRTAIIRPRRTALATTAPTPAEPQATEPETGKIMVSMKLADADKTSAALVDEEAVADAVVTDEQREAVNQGNNIEIKVETSPLEQENVSREQQQTIVEAMAKFNEQINNLSLGRLMDISMFMRMNDSDWNQITSTKEPIEITVDVPEDIQGAESYYMMRLHDDEITLLPDLDQDPDTVTIASDRFSTYMLMYVAAAQEIVLPEPEAVEEEEPEEEGPKCHVCHMCPTFLGICLFIWLIILVGAIIFILTVYFHLKKNKEE